MQQAILVKDEEVMDTSKNTKKRTNQGKFNLISKSFTDRKSTRADSEPAKKRRKKEKKISVKNFFEDQCEEDEEEEEVKAQIKGKCSQLI